MSTSILFYIVSGIVIIILLWILTIEIRFKKFFAGTKAINLEETIFLIGRKINQIEKVEGEINNHLITIDKRLNKSIRNVETIRFNPFIDGGGNQSFAMSLVNDEGNGVVLSSLYARDRMSIFAKPIIKWKSTFELSSEEKEVLEKTKQ